MKFSCYKNDLIDALKLVGKAVAAKPQTPILSGIYLNAQGNQVELQANNFSLGITAKIPAHVETEGEVVVSGKRLADFVKGMPDDTITFSNEDNQNSLAITSGGANVDLLTMHAEDFPKIKPLETDRSFQISSSMLSNLIGKTAFAVAEDESRPVFTGVLFELRPNKITLVATNTHRLAFATDYIDNANETSFIVPAETLRSILPMLNTESDNKFVFVNYSSRNLSLTFDNFIVTSRLIEGVFPPYDKVIPEETATHVQLDTAEFKQAVKFVALMAKEAEYNAVKFVVLPNGIVISADSQDAGSAVKEIEAQVEGNGLNISFNVAYIADWLSTVEAKIINIDFNGQLEPVKFTELDNKNFIYVATPIRT